MNAAFAPTIEEETRMTDFQFKALMAMVLEILESKENLEDAKQAIARLAGELAKPQTETSQQ